MMEGGGSLAPRIRKLRFVKAGKVNSKKKKGSFALSPCRKKKRGEYDRDAEKTNNKEKPRLEPIKKKKKRRGKAGSVRGTTGTDQTKGRQLKSVRLEKRKGEKRGEKCHRSGEGVHGVPE